MQVSGTCFFQPHVHLEPHHCRGVPAGDRKQFGGGLGLRAWPEISSTVFQRWPTGSADHSLSLVGGNGSFHFSFQGKDEEGGGERAGVSQEVTHFPRLAQSEDSTAAWKAVFTHECQIQTCPTKRNILTTHYHYPPQPQNSGPRARARF